MILSPGWKPIPVISCAAALLICAAGCHASSSDASTDASVRPAHPLSVKTPSEAAAPPHIIVIMADDLGWGDLGCYGSEEVHSPHLDALASEGVRATRFYSNCSVCSPTRASLLTGLYPDEAGVPGVIRTHPDNSFGYLRQDVPLLPEMLTGFDTALIGKWHLGLDEDQHPMTRGFDHFHGFLGDRVEDYWTHQRDGHHFMRLGYEDISPEGHLTDLFTDWAVDYIEQHADSDEPFFLYLAHCAPHDPIQPPEDWLARVRERAPDMSEERAGLVALIEHMDAGVGRVLNALDACNLTDSTLVIFTSDNGGALNVLADNGDLHGGKGQPYEGGIRVPMIVRWPGRIPAGGWDMSGEGLTMDLLPSILEAAGISAPEHLSGISLLQRWQNAAAVTAPQFETRPLWWVRREGGLYAGGESWAVRMGRWKLLSAGMGNGRELYDLQTDPLEQHNLLDTQPQHPQLRQLLNELRRRRQHGGTVPWQHPARADIPGRD